MDKEFTLDVGEKQVIIDSLSTIKQMCMDCEDCLKCPVYSHKYKDCLFHIESPTEWNLKVSESIWRAVE